MVDKCKANFFLKLAKIAIAPNIARSPGLARADREGVGWRGGGLLLMIIMKYKRNRLKTVIRDIFAKQVYGMNY